MNPDIDLNNSNMIIKLLQNTFIERKNKNSKYSLRAFARDLKVTPSQLSGLMSGKVGVSTTKALSIAQRLGLTEADAELFVLSAKRSFERSKMERNRAERELNKHGKDNSFELLEIETIAPLQSWKYFAAYEAVGIFSSRAEESQVQSISQKFSWHIEETSTLLKNLKNLGILLHDGKRFLQRNPFIGWPDDTALPNLINISMEVLDKAKAALNLRNINEREFGSVFFTLSENQIPKAKKLIRKFQDEFAKEMSKTKTRKDLVYCIATQLFPIDDKT